MTTVIADLRFGVMVSDSNITDTNLKWSARKVWRVKGTLVGMAGYAESFLPFLVWCRGGMQDSPPKTPNLDALVLSSTGLLLFQGGGLPVRIESGRHAIGTGAMAALSAYEALNWSDPKRAVRIVCKHDAGSRGPVRVYTLER